MICQNEKGMDVYMEQKSKSWKRGFLTITAGQTVSLIGSSAVQFSLIWWLASETGSPMVMSLAGLFAFLPQMLLGPFAGVWTDRLRRKTVIICADMFIGIVALGMSLFFVFGSPPYWSAFLVLGMRSLGNVFHSPAIQAAVPMLVPQDQLVKANGWSQFMQSGAFMLGPVLGAAMYAALPLWIILLSDLAGAIAASLTVAAVKIPDPERNGRETPHLFKEMKEGAAALLEDRALITVSVASVVAMVFYMPLSTYYPLMSSDHFGATAWHAGLVELLYATGMMACAIIFSRFGNIRRKMKVIHWGLFGLGLTSLICGLLPRHINWFWLFAAACTLMGASGNIYNIPYVAYLQENIPPEKMGRVFSLIISVSSASMPLGLLVAGPVAESRGVWLWFLISGIATIMITAISAILVRSVPVRAQMNSQEEQS